MNHQKSIMFRLWNDFRTFPEPNLMILGCPRGPWEIIVGYFFANKETVEDKRDYYDRHGQPKLDDKE